MGYASFLGMALVVAAPGPKEAVPKKADPPGLVGVWACDGRTEGGVMFPPPAAADLKLEFTADGKVRVRDGGRPEVVGKYTTNPKNGPVDVDFTKGPGDDYFWGIYKVEGGVLTLCFEDRPGGARPAAFESTKGTQQVLLTLRRAEVKKE